MPALSDSLAKARRSTFWTLLIGYGMYYLCRANLGVAAPLLEKELHFDKIDIGRIGGISTLVYALGKFTLGPTADLFGGKRVFLFGLAAAVVVNIAFGFSTALIVLIVLWSINRFVQSAGWMGLVQLVGGWYERRDYGVVMAWLSLSFLLGDVVARGFGSGVLLLGFSRPWLFFIPAIVCGLFVLVANRTLIVRPAAETKLEAAPEDEPVEAAEVAQGVGQIFAVLARSWGFWLAAMLSFFLTFLRTVFLDWTVVFLVDSGTVTWKAALQSALFPLTGAAGTLFAGWYSDRVSKSRRGPIAAAMLGLSVVALLLLALFGVALPTFAVVLIGATGFLLIGPYSFLGGCISLDFGGKKAAATAAGLNDGIGYLGGSASGLILAGVAQRYGWSVAFFILAGASAISFVIAVVFALTGEKKAAAG